MPTSIGIDIVEIDRIRRVVETHGNRFLKKVYSAAESSLCSRRVDKYACLAARFAAKEAFRKAISMQVSLAFKDIAVTSGRDGSPSLELPRTAGEKLPGRFSVSLSHSREYAVAVVLWERIG